MKEVTHDLSHDLTFYCTHNQLCVPQNKVNVYSTWDIYSMFPIKRTVFFSTVTVHKNMVRLIGNIE